MLAEAIGLEDPAEALEMVRGLLDSGVDANARGWDGEPPLFKALNQSFRSDQFDTVRLLVDRGSECHWEPELIDLLFHGPADVFESFFERSMGWAGLIEILNGEPCVDENPISKLIEEDLYIQLEHQWTRGLDVLLNVYSRDCGDTPLIAAVDNGDHKAVRWLQAKGADVNLHAEFCVGYTALDRAVFNNDVEMVRWLLGSGANPNTPTWMSITTVGRTRMMTTDGRASNDDLDKASQIRSMILEKADLFPPSE